MDKTQAYKRIKDYIKKYNLLFEESIDNGVLALTMCYKAEIAPLNVIESRIWFYNDSMEVHHYYSQQGANMIKQSNNLNDIYRILNFINARVFVKCGNPYGLYQPSSLYTPRIYLTEDGCGDITITTIINYDVYELAPVETEEYITAFCPELLDKLTFPILYTAADRFSIDEAIEYIKRYIINPEE